MVYQLGPADPRERNDHYYTEEPEYEPEPAPRRRLWLLVGLVVSVMCLFAGGLWFAYVQGAKSVSGRVASSTATGAPGSVPLIRADDRPTKMKPDQPGGIDIPDQDKLVYDEARGQNRARAGGERLLPAPEKPMPRPVAPPPSAASANQSPAGQSPAGQAPAGQASPGPAAPAGAGTSPAAPQNPADAASAGQQQAALSAKPGKPEPAKPDINKPGTGKLPATAAGGLKLQLGSVRTEEAAKTEWDRIKKANSDLLGSLSASGIRVDLGDKGVHYRVQAGPVADPAAAERICGELKKRNVGCIIAR